MLRPEYTRCFSCYHVQHVLCREAVVPRSLFQLHVLCAAMPGVVQHYIIRAGVGVLRSQRRVQGRAVHQGREEHKIR